MTVVNATTALATLAIQAGAAVGPRSVTVTTGLQSATLANAFTVTAGTPVLLSLAPNSGQQGSSQSVTFTAQYTNFQTNAPTLQPVAGLTFSNIQVLTATTFTAQVAVDAGATLGAKSITVVSNGQNLTLANAFTVTAGTPVLLSLAPNSGQQGSSQAVTFTAQYTNFQTNAPTIQPVAGLTFSNIQVLTATTFTAQVAVDAGATVGPKTVTVVSNGQNLSLANAFTVTDGTPVLISLNPNSGQQGSSQQVTFTAQYTNFQTHAPTLQPVAGLTFSNIQVLTPTTFTAQVAVDQAAALGAKTITVVSNSQNLTLANAFTVTVGTPVLLSLAPNSGQQGSSQAVTFTGQYTNFQTHAPTLQPVAGLTFSNIQVLTPTTFTAQVAVDTGATLGAKSITVVTNGQNLTLANAFTVTAGTPVLLSLAPNSGQQGSSQQVTFTAQYTNFQTNAPSIQPVAGLTFSNIQVLTATTLTAQVAVDAGATVGPKTVTVVTNGQNLTLANAFTVTPGTPVLTSVNPTTLPQGQTSQFTINGNFTNFTTSSVITATPADGLTIGSPLSATATSLTVGITASNTAATTARRITVTTGGETVFLDNALTITAGTPVLTSINPTSGPQGQTVQVTINGQFTDFVNHPPTVGAIAGITVTNIQPVNATSFTANFNIASNATTGLRSIQVTTNGQNLTLANAFTVNSGTPVLSSISPTSGRRAETVNVTFTGQFTQFDTQAPTVQPIDGITISNIVVQNATTFTAQFAIAANAALGARNVTVTSNGQNLTLNNAFTVQDGLPVLTSVNPVSGVQGTNVNLSLAGNFTTWSAASVVSFSPPTGITVGNVTFNSTTSISVAITIAANAPTGARNVTVTTGPEVVTLNNAFTVNPGVPALLSLAPNSGKQNETVQVTFTTAFTDLQTHAPTVQPIAGITVSNIQVTSAASFTAQFAIQLAATVGPRNVTVVSNGQNLTLNNAFAVTPGPVLDSVTPNLGQQSATVPVTISGTNTNFTNSSVITFAPADGITVSNVSATNGTTLTASLQIAANASLGLRNVTVTTGSEIVTKNNAFEVFPPSGTVSGTVFEANGTTPAPNVTLRLFRGTPETKFTEVTTNGSGQYSIPNVPGGPYQVFASNTGNTQFARAAGSIVVQGTVTNNLTLGGSGSVQATVRDTNDALVPNAPVTVEIFGDNIPDEVRALYRRNGTANGSAVASFSDFPAGAVLGTATNVSATRGGQGNGSMGIGGTAAFTIYLAPGAGASSVVSVMRGVIAAEDLPVGLRGAASNIISVIRGGSVDTLPPGQNSAASSIVSILRGGIIDTLPTGLNAASSSIVSLLRGSIVDTLPTGFNAAASSIVSLARGTPPQTTLSVGGEEGAISQVGSPAASRSAPLRIAGSRPAVLYAGQSVRFTAEGAGKADFLINGMSFGHDVDDPAALTFLVPEGVKELTLRVAPEGNLGEGMVSEEVRYEVAQAKAAAIAGRVTGPDGEAREGVEVAVRHEGLTVDLFDLDRPLTEVPELAELKLAGSVTVAGLNVRNPGRASGASALAPELAPDYAARFRGELAVEKAGEYRFRLQTSGAARFKLNGVEVAQGGESEFSARLDAGSAALELVTVAGSAGEDARLFWQKPGEEAWRLVPAEAYSAGAERLKARTSAEGDFLVEGVPGSAASAKVSAQTSELEGGTDRLRLVAGSETRVEIPTRRKVQGESSNNGKVEEK